ncbi:MAG: FISUMP domain-containing protein [Bacteroidota bacterium]
MHRLTSTILTLLLIPGLFPVVVLAEGTKQILLTEGGHGKIEVRPSTNDFAWYASNGASGNPAHRLNIHISSIGEKIYYGFGDPLNNNDQIVNDVQYRIKDPLGNIVVGPVALPLSGTGHISTFAQAVTGPSGIVGGSGYPSLSYTPTMTGDYFIEFNFNTGGVNDRCKFRYFDITVGSLTNQAVDGRVWSKAWQMTADNQAPPSGVYTFWGTLYVYSDDGIVTSVDFNGMEPYVFVVSCNPWGCYNTGVFNNDRRSVSGNHTLTQYKIFLNDPDSLTYPTGILGTVVPPIVVTPSCAGTSTIQVEVTKAGNLDILLNLNPAPGKQAEDVQLSATVTTGVNTIPWNGLNGLGQPVPNGTTFDIIVTYINGLTNLPIYDVEVNPSGFIIELHRPAGLAPPVFWDDILVGGSQNFTGCTFVPPTTGCHTFGYTTGNNNTVNTWWYAVTSISPPVVFTQLREPQSQGTITGTATLCQGTTGQQYWVYLEPNSDSTIWNYTGTGATITVINDSTISIDYAINATSGNLTVVGYNSDCGAGSTQSTKAITVFPLPVVSLVPFTPVCIDALPFPLTGGTPAGGTYTINGIPVTTFDPQAYGVGSQTVYYTYIDPGTGCTSNDSKSLVVNPLPMVTLASQPSVCVNDPPFTLTGGNPANGIYSGPGVSNDSIFDPSVAGTGTHNIIYTFTDGSGCTNSDTATLTVFPLPQVILLPFGNICVNAAPITLTGGTPGGGSYSGPGVSGGIFDPAAAGVGTHQIIYTYTDANTCTNSDTSTITVDPLPGTPGMINGATTVCQGTSSVAYNTTPIANATSYLWSITPPAAGTVSGTTTSILINWSASYTGVALITVKGLNNCGEGVPSAPYPVTVNPNPVVTFTRCFDSVTLTIAKPIVLKGGIPLSGTYSGPGVTAGILYPALAGGGVHTITYNYTNSYGCFNSTTRSITIQTPAPWNCGSLLTDLRDGKQYATVQIGTQCWMAASLNYGQQIMSSTSQRDNCVAEKYCYNDLPAGCTFSGGRYQWDEVMAYQSAEGLQGLCPPGWHIPTEAEWTTLFNQYINNGFAGSALKVTGFSGFNALLAGFQCFNLVWNYGPSDPVLRSTLYWSSTSRGLDKAWAHGMSEVAADVEYTPSVSYYPSYRSNSFSVRCLKD